MKMAMQGLRQRHRAESAWLQMKRQFLRDDPRVENTHIQLYKNENVVAEDTIKRVERTGHGGQW